MMNGAKMIQHLIPFKIPGHKRVVFDIRHISLGILWPRQAGRDLMADQKTQNFLRKMKDRLLRGNG